MFESFLNGIFLKFWSGKEKVGPNKRILLSKSFEVFGSTVYDLTWSMKYIHDNGKTSHSVTITERANKWNMRRVIRRVEKSKLPRAIDSIIKNHTEGKEQKEPKEQREPKKQK